MPSHPHIDIALPLTILEQAAEPLDQRTSVGPSRRAIAQLRTEIDPPLLLPRPECGGRGWRQRRGKPITPAAEGEVGETRHEGLGVDVGVDAGIEVVAGSMGQNVTVGLGYGHGAGFSRECRR
jgi:hypothetical protein